MKIRLYKKTMLTVEVKSYGLLSGKVSNIFALEKFKEKRSEHFSKLTTREIEILALLAEGLSNQEIKNILNISRNTIENHRKSINRKLEIRHFRDIFKYALAFGLVPFTPK